MMKLLYYMNYIPLENQDLRLENGAFRGDRAFVIVNERINYILITVRTFGCSFSRPRSRSVTSLFYRI